MKRMVLGCLLVAASAMAFYGCAGKEGPTGPAGTAGATGAAGPDAKFYNFSCTFKPDTLVRSYSLAGTAFDQDDIVLVYVEHPLPSHHEWILLPWLYCAPPYTPTPLYLWSAVDSTAPTLRLCVGRTDTSSSPPFYGVFIATYKAVVIEASAGKSPPAIDYRDYEAVKQYYGLPD